MSNDILKQRNGGTLAKSFILFIALRQLKLYWQPLVFYDSKRSIGFVRFFVTTRRGVLVSYGFFSFSFFFVLMTLGIFIGGDSLEGVNLFHTSFRHHSLC